MISRRHSARRASVITLRGLVMILELHQQGLSVSAIAARTSVDRKTVRKYIARGLEPPVYGPRVPRARLLEPYEQFVRARLAAFPELSIPRLLREIRPQGYSGGLTVLGDFVRAVRPQPAPAFELRFETAAGEQAQVDFAHFKVVFEDEPDQVRIVWLFSLVLGHSRYLWARFVVHQDVQTVLRCHMAAFEHLQGVPRQICESACNTDPIGADFRVEI